MPYSTNSVSKALSIAFLILHRLYRRRFRLRHCVVCSITLLLMASLCGACGSTIETPIMQLPLPRTTTLTSHPFGLEWTPDGTLYLDWLDSGTVRAQSTIWRLPHQVQQWEQLRAINQHCNNPTLQRIAGTADKLGLACIIGVKIVRCRLARFFTIYPPRQSAPYSHLISRPKVGIFGMCNDRKGWCPVEIFLAPCNG